MGDFTKHWNESKIMIRALLVMISGILGSVIVFIKAMNINLAWLETISKYLTVANIDMAMNWISGVIAVIMPVLGLSIWIARKKSDGKKIVSKNAPQFPRTFTQR
jgi:hypothetical protein